jgi:hypothetical protein
MAEHFCTYFDHRYAPKGLAMWRSLKRFLPEARLHVLCLTPPCYEILKAHGLEDVTLYGLAEIERADPDLVHARRSRSLVEYYFTLTPCLPLYLLEVHPELDRLTYVDADLFFFASPEPVFAEIGDSSVAIIEHRFPEALAHLREHGRFNVGWLTFRHDAAAQTCLSRWRAQCLEWCYDRLEDGRFAEQRYLDTWPTTVPGLRIVQHRGANVAPWNIAAFALGVRGDALTVDGEPLLFFHAHGFKASSPGRPRVSGLEPYGAPDLPLISDLVLAPYEAALKAAVDDLAAPLTSALLADQARDTDALIEHLAARDAVRDAQIAAIESDRTARLESIRSLQEQLAASDADRAARLEVIRTLEERVRASAADDAARLETLTALRGQLEARTVENQVLADELGRAQARVRALEHSRTWRWTRLLRWMAGRFRS